MLSTGDRSTLGNWVGKVLAFRDICPKEMGTAERRCVDAEKPLRATWELKKIVPACWPLVLEAFQPCVSIVTSLKMRPGS